ncbi:BamA/TamA family outer membrane protein [Ruegeria atlantica]|uniref:BamA/TamA family outer membrane protein n=1 Tax=Ruegeria atlantica TaxID=81569 RepID=A0ABX1WD34_9RHOB|nr:BamA/TamA family outer membrane protein [Ruegeria atlantica]NOD31154.1 BamA/TamA family outer membrane protein [Ruegeria atlantica]
MSKLRTSLAGICAVAMFCTAFAASAEGTDDNASQDKSELGFKNGSFVGVPIPINDPTFGAGLVLGVGYLFQSDEGSKTSSLGAAIAGTNKESYAIGLGGGLSLDNNRQNVEFILAYADLKYDLFLINDSINVAQQGLAFQGAYRYSFTDTFSAGASLQYLNTVVSGVDGIALPPEVAELSDTAIATVGLVAKWDTRDDTFYPVSGNKVDLALTYSNDVQNGDLSYYGLKLSYDKFWPVSNESAIAFRATACEKSDRTPFFDSCLLGSEIRGFPLFDVYGNSMLTAQAEYRGRLSKRFGYVAFAGGGEVQKNSISVDSSFRYAGGVGLRYRVTKKHKLDFSIDAAVNDDGDDFLYFYVGQRF